MILLSLIISFYGFLHFAMSVKKHQMDVYKGWLKAEPLTSREYWTFQMIGWFCMVLSYALALREWSVGIGTMAWLMLITVSALAVVALLSYRLSWLQRLWDLVCIGRRLAPPKAK